MTRPPSRRQASTWSDVKRSCMGAILAKARRRVTPPAARRVGVSMLFDDEKAPRSLEAVAAGIEACRRCDLWRNATQGVPGEGPHHAPIMLVGEQPGDQEDLAGKPFVGPAG